jgi:ribosomal protein L7/L12
MQSNSFSASIDELDAGLVRYYDVISFVRSGQKIKAIKIYREDTGASLFDAKVAIERIEQQMRMEIPHPLVEQAPIVAPARPLDSGVWREEMESLLRQGYKIKAIKLYREQTGVGLQEAKRAVEQIEEGLRLDTMPPPTPLPVMGDPGEAVRSLILAGQKIQAIKLYREQTGVGLREAKDAVDAMEEALRLGLE